MLYNMFGAPIVDGYQAAVEGQLDECTAVEEFEKAFERIAGGRPQEAGGEEGEDVIGEFEEVAQEFGVEGGFVDWE